MLKLWKNLGTIFAVLMATITVADAQCNTWASHPKGVQLAKEQHVIYRDLIRSKKYKEAFPIWNDLFQHVQVPTITVKGKDKKIAHHYQDGIQIYKEFAQAEKDATKKKEYISKMMDLYDKMATCLGEKSLDRAYQGYYLWYLQGDSRKVVELFEKSMELGGNKTNSMVLAPMSQLTVYLFGAYEGQEGTKFTADYMRSTYDKLKALADYNIANNKKTGAQYKTAWATVQAEFDKVGGKIWGCDFHQGKIRPQFESARKNMEQNASLLKQLKKKCGKDNELYKEIAAIYDPWQDSVSFEAKKAKFEGLCNLDKGKFKKTEARRATKKGDATLAKELETEADQWFEKSLDDPITDDCMTTEEDKGKLAYSLAYKYYKKGAYSKARSLCYKAAEHKKGWGEPYMLIGSMYASSGKRCSGGKGTGWDAQVVAWAASDMWSKAKSIDSSVAGEANSRIAKYRKYYPTAGDIFQRGHKIGASYKVGCWIGVTTTIRAAKE